VLKQRKLVDDHHLGSAGHVNWTDVQQREYHIVRILNLNRYSATRVIRKRTVQSTVYCLDLARAHVGTTRGMRKGRRNSRLRLVDAGGQRSKSVILNLCE